ncbi:MAG: hypothetical protein K9H49_14685 [Bacteroidales bacterium]|nr:hypothetical protein [Bacteroidales bacterium]MCF8390547.1 hypothetical protein [Bacteroidales bacterium]
MKNIYLGDAKLNTQKKVVEGGFVEIENEKFYKISNFGEMPDFFMTIVSDSDHWMYLSSNGSLSAGRKNRDNALFPYYTDDKIHDYKNKTGSKTFCLVEKKGKSYLWEPFTDESAKVYRINRNLYKSIYGNKIIFEEVNLNLEVAFQYGWYNSEKFGWIKKSVVRNLAQESVSIELLDGIQNILPSGVDYAFQSEYSNLLDAYKKNELLPESKLGLFMLSSIPVDKAEPSEALKTNTVWSLGMDPKAKILISNNQVENFRKGLSLDTEIDVRAARGSYYINTALTLEKDEKKDWYLLAEINQDSVAVANLNLFIKTEKNIEKQLVEDISKGTANLVKKVANADGLQLGNEELGYARHFSNTLFNIMRGGIYTNNYTIDLSDFKLFLEHSNKEVFDKFRENLNRLPQQINYSELILQAKKLESRELERISHEYLPLTFSRRHGDPSRPWNQFSIDIKNKNGSDKLNYQGNWRDIFQNWEALNLSFPDYVEGIISKFLNATTADGYNPYRISRDGIDWEAPDPHDPWAYIGYWGDHQIIYLQKILEQSDNFHPGKLDEWLSREVFVFANVPYRIKAFEEIVKNPKDTIEFDHALNKEISLLTSKTGSDGRLLRNKEGGIYTSNLTEKILITLLAKLSNFIPEAGIWLTTQRPEWNDANNALVGNGVSMVTLYYLRRFLKFWEEKFSSTSAGEIYISEEVKLQFDKTFSLFAENTGVLEKGFSDEDRYRFTHTLGTAGSEYRSSIYKNSFSGKKSLITPKSLQEFMQLALKYIDQSIKKNKRKDGLFHAYNLISIKGRSMNIRYLYEMLEGQVAVLNSGYLSPKESLAVLNSLKLSSMFREDQYSYILYPDRQLPRFVEKNNIPGDAVKDSQLLQKLLSDNDSSILNKDLTGKFHFNGDFRNSALLESALERLSKKEYGKLVEKEKEQILNLFEKIFDHQSFTGRSGTFYGYEGLGSIYWHMVSKLLLAAQEAYFQGIKENVDSETFGKIKQHYYEIKAGIGLYKSPELYGAFPTDAYSHTPGHAGVKQPGLTGQVKEDVLSRFGELGIIIENGEITFSPSLLNNNEKLKLSETFNYYDLKGNKESISLKEQQLGFTFCQIPVIFTFGKDEKISLVFDDGTRKEFRGNIIPKEISSKIFTRSGEVKRIDYFSPN